MSCNTALRCSMRVSLKMLQSMQYRELTGMWWTSSAVFQQHTDAPRKQASMILNCGLLGCMAPVCHKGTRPSISMECQAYAQSAAYADVGCKVSRTCMHCSRPMSWVAQLCSSVQRPSRLESMVSTSSRETGALFIAIAVLSDPELLRCAVVTNIPLTVISRLRSQTFGSDSL